MNSNESLEKAFLAELTSLALIVAHTFNTVDHTDVIASNGSAAATAPRVNGSRDVTAGRPSSSRESYSAPNEAERAVLCSMIIDDRCIPDVLELIGRFDFTDRANAAVFSVIEKLHRNGKPIDVVLLISELEDADGFKEEPRIFLAGLSEAVATSAHAKHYAGIVREARRRNQLLDQAEEIRLGVAAGKPADEIIADMQSDLEDKLRANPAHSVEYRRYSCRDLMAGDFETRYLIEGTLVAQQPLILAGPSKSLKTTMLLEAGVSLATATPMLSRLAVPHATRTGIMTGESGLATIRETSQRIAISKGLHLDEIEGLVFSPDIPRFGDQQHADAVRRFIEADELEVLCIDPAYLAIPSDNTANVFAQGELLRSMAQVCDDAGATLVLAHHTNSRATMRLGEPLELEDIAWAGFKEFARQWWLVNRRTPYEPGTGSHQLWLSIGGSAGQSALWAVDAEEGLTSKFEPRKWEVELTPASEARRTAAEGLASARTAAQEVKARAQAESDRDAVRDALVKINQPETQKGIAAVARISNGRAAAALADLEQSGDVRRCDVAKANGRKYEGFELCKE